VAGLLIFRFRFWCFRPPRPGRVCAFFAALRNRISLYFPSTLEATGLAEFAQKIRATSQLAVSLAVLRRAFELAGVEFMDENGGGPGVQLRNHPRSKQSK
jgi:hypothetical protein